MAANQTTLMTANEAASVTGVPLRQVHRIIDAGLMGGAVKRRDNARLLAPKALVGLKPGVYVPRITCHVCLTSMTVRCKEDTSSPPNLTAHPWAGPIGTVRWDV